MDEWADEQEFSGFLASKFRKNIQNSIFYIF
jgi:hypothetical protein